MTDTTALQSALQSAFTQAADVLAGFGAATKFSSVVRVQTSARHQVNDVLAYEFSVAHDKDRKQYRATLTTFRFLDGTWVVVLHSGFRTVGLKAAARYSEKGLKDFWSEMFTGGSLEDAVVQQLLKEGVA
jgi:uncharacterized protein YndB with AHSA1/START domain